MLEKLDYDRMFEIENELCTKHDLSDEEHKLIFDYGSLKEKIGRYNRNMFPEKILGRLKSGTNSRVESPNFISRLFQKEMMPNIFSV